MRTKEDYYQSALKQRELVKDSAIMACTCPETLCQWHGKCAQCVALYRHFAYPGVPATADLR